MNGKNQYKKFVSLSHEDILIIHVVVPKQVWTPALLKRLRNITF